jgi:hypothetical protein
MPDGDIRVEDGRLVFDNGRSAHDLAIGGNSHVLRVGCLTLSWKAWELLRDRVRKMFPEYEGVKE